MTLFDELRIFARHILSWFYSFIGFSVFFFLFTIKEITIYGYPFLIPILSENSLSVQVFNMMRFDLLPTGVQLITTNPMSAFIAQVSFSLTLGFLLTIPFFLYELIMYIRPSLFPYEKKIVLWSILPSVSLFFSGAIFSYLFLIPATFRVLYPYSVSLGALPLFSIEEFIFFVIGLMMGVGLMFLLPLFMILLSSFHIIEAKFWKEKWQFASLFFLILSAIITPDGTGVTMAILFVPLVTLYFVGYLFAKKMSRQTPVTERSNL